MPNALFFRDTTNPGLWTLDWTKDWTMDLIILYQYLSSGMALYTHTYMYNDVMGVAATENNKITGNLLTVLAYTHAQ